MQESDFEIVGTKSITRATNGFSFPQKLYMGDGVDFGLLKQHQQRVKSFLFCFLDRTCFWNDI